MEFKEDAGGINKENEKNFCRYFIGKLCIIRSAYFINTFDRG